MQRELWKVRIAWMRRPLGLLGTALLLVLMAGCGGKGKTPQQPAAQPDLRPQKIMVIVSDPLWGQTELDPVTSANVATLLGQLQPSPLKLSEVSGAGGKLQGELRGARGTSKLIFGYNIVAVNDKVYEGPAAESLYRLVSQNIYSGSQLARQAERCGKVRLKANDVKKETFFPDRKALVEAFRQVSLLGDETLQESAVAGGDLFPAYSIEIPADGKSLVVNLNRPNYCYVNDPYRTLIFENAASLWDLCGQVLPCPQPEPGELTYLLTATALSSPELGSLNHRRLSISRLLQEGALTPQKEISGMVYRLVYVFASGEKVTVQVGKDAFKFGGKVYRLPGVSQKIRDIASAG